MKRVFLNWDRPAIPSAVKFLLESYSRDRLVDLSKVIVVLPGGRAGRRLNELLWKECTANSIRYLPPRITTVGSLPELLYSPQRPFASDLLQLLAWSEALKQTPSKDLKELVKTPPTDDDAPHWIELAALIQRQHRELAGDGFNFEEVLSIGKRIPEFDEDGRWSALAKVQDRYLRILDSLGVWDRQTARLRAIDQTECEVDSDIVLVATADMNRTTRRMLDQVGHRVTSLVFAPETLSDRFDRHGCLRIDAWQDAQLPITDDQLVLVNDSTEQADAVVDAIDEFDGRYSAKQITIGVPDESLIPHLEYSMSQAGLSARWGPGDSLERSRPFRLLRILADYLRDQTFENLAELLRNVDVGAWLRLNHHDPNDLLRKLDRFQQTHVPSDAEGFSKSTVDAKIPERIEAEVEKLLKPLLGKRRQPKDWIREITSVLASVFRMRQLRRDDPADRISLAAFDALRTALLELQNIPETLMKQVPAWQAIFMVLAQTKNQLAARLPDPHSIELVGWLEMPLDDASAKILTSFNEGFIPSSIDADLFLPNSLRSALGIDDSHRLFARDIYAANAVVASTHDVRFVVAKFRADGEPSLPSRLLFAADDDVVLRRSLTFFSETLPPRPADRDVDRLAAQHRFCVPPPSTGERSLQRMSVTAFRTYLECPYRFYLRHVEKLQDCRDDYSELTPGSYGELVHQVVSDFGAGAERDSCDEAVIREFLEEALHARAKERFGSRPRPAVQIQIEQLKIRLAAFAAVQASRRAEGWRIFKTEHETEQLSARFETENNEVELVGRIDRIDFNEQSGRYAILDYKTSSKARTPDQAHRDKDEWKDLQLPLYRYFTPSLGIPRDVDLGYVVLPDDPAGVAFLMADWSKTDLAKADETARQVVDDILAGKFWPPQLIDPTRDDFAIICQSTVFDRRYDEQWSPDAARESTP